MNIANEDKITLLEFLGYKPWIDAPLRYVTEKESILFADFNPLDISVLTKALDIIEKEGYITEIKKKGYYYCSIYKETSSIKTIYRFSNKREEAIFNAVLEYIKTNK